MCLNISKHLRMSFYFQKHAWKLLAQWEIFRDDSKWLFGEFNSLDESNWSIRNYSENIIEGSKLCTDSCNPENFQLSYFLFLSSSSVSFAQKLMTFSWFQGVFFFQKKVMCDNPEFSQLLTIGTELWFNGPILEWNSEHDNCCTQSHAAFLLFNSTKFLKIKFREPINGFSFPHKTNETENVPKRPY